MELQLLQLDFEWLYQPGHVPARRERSNCECCIRHGRLQHLLLPSTHALLSDNC